MEPITPTPIEEAPQTPPVETREVQDTSKKENLGTPFLPVVIVIIILGVALLATFLLRFIKKVPPQQIATTTVSVGFTDVTLSAKAAYVLDLTTNKPLFEKESQSQLPLASLTKLMTALIAEETLSSTTPITLTAQALRTEGDSGLRVGEKWNRDNLLAVALVSSSNDAAAAIGESVDAIHEGTNTPSVVTRMNERARNLGLSQTYFLNPTGLDINATFLGGAYGSARDIAHLMGFIIEKYPHVLQNTELPKLSVRSEQGTMHTLQNTNTALGILPWIIGSKTGYTDLAGGNLAIVFDAGLAHPVVAVVLGSTREARFTDMQQLVDATFRAFSSTDTSQQRAVATSSLNTNTND